MGGKSVHLKLGTGQRNLEEEKSARVRGSLWLWDSEKLLLARQLASACSLSCAVMIWSVIGDVYCSEKKNPGAAIDNLRQKSVRRELFKLNFGKRKKTASVVSNLRLLKICLNSSGPPSDSVVWLLWTVGLSVGANPACHPGTHPGIVFFFLFFFKLSFLISRDDSHIWDTGSLSTITEISYTLLHHVPRKLLGSWDVPLTLHSRIFVFGHILVSCLRNIHLLWFQPVFFCWLSSFHGPDSCLSGSVRAPEPLGSWPTSESVFDIRVSLSLSMRRGAGEALLLWGGHTQSRRQCSLRSLSKQIVDQRSCFPALNNENKAA